MELCINNAWGTVCGTSFSVPDAQVACNQLVGFQREGLYICGYLDPHIISCDVLTGAERVNSEVQITSGPIFLDELRCTGNEQSLLDCPTGISEVGLTNCDHSQDVWVKCRGGSIDE